MYLVFDIGGTNMRWSLSADGEGLSEVKIVPTPKEFETGLSIIKKTVSEMETVQKIQAAAGGITGMLNKNKSKLEQSVNLHDWVGKPLRKDLEEIFGVPVKLENDAAVEGLGEATLGAGRRKQIVGYITVSTGIGGVKIINGELDPHVYGFEPGKQVMDFEGEVRRWEDFASGTAINKLFGKPGQEIVDPQIWENEARIIALGLQNVIVMWSPEIVILGGSVMKSVPWDKLRGYLAVQMQDFPRLPEIVAAELGDRAGLLGALKLFSRNGF